ncbi:MAG: hypothetical protein HQL21_04550 [Candidatus Omnitrophica bacterium]|nr:hypothetical protein [Candidatus Omnitrophota bacterium]
MSSKPKDQTDANDGLINGKECVHCGLWFKLERAKPVPGTNSIRCPNCDWMVEGGKS